MQPDQLLHTGEAARICGVTTQTIVNWIRRGRLRAATTEGGRFRIQGESLVRLLRQRGFEVPRTLEAPPRRVVVIDGRAAPGPGQGAAFLATARRVLAPLGDVEVFTDAHRALLAIGVRPPDVVVLDLESSGAPGPGVLAAMRAEEVSRSIPVVLIARFEEELALAQRYGATVGVLEGSASRLVDAVRRVLV